jgi:hypothetical protein
MGDDAADNGDHTYIAYAYQNRISKYSPAGTLLFSADRTRSMSHAFTNIRSSRDIDRLILCATASSNSGSSTGRWSGDIFCPVTDTLRPPAHDP